MNLDVSKEKRESNVIPIIFIFLMMILIAICDSVRGVFIPVFQTDFHVNNTEIGVMLTSASLGYIVSTYVGGELCEKIGQKKVYILGYIFIIISLFSLTISYKFYLLLVSMFFLNVGQAFIGISTNTLVPVLFLTFQAVLMNLTHFCYGLGSAFGQRFAGIMIFKGFGWRNIYFMIAVFALVLFLLFLFVKVPEVNKSSNSVKIDKKRLLKNKLIYLYILGLGFYVFAEMATGNWFVNFIEKNYNYNKSESSFYIAIFFIVFAIGRFLGGFIVEKTGYINTVLISIIFAFILYVTGLLCGSKGLIIISMSGFFFSITFPTIVLTISKVFKEGSAYITGIIVTFTSFISMLLNLLVGYLNDKLNTYISFWLIPLSLLISGIFIFFIYRYTKKDLSK